MPLFVKSFDHSDDPEVLLARLKCALDDVSDQSRKYSWTPLDVKNEVDVRLITDSQGTWENIRRHQISLYI